MKRKKYRLRIRLPDDYNITRDMNTKLELKKWCVEKALGYYVLDENGNNNQADLILTANKIYNWVKK